MVDTGSDVTRMSAMNVPHVLLSKLKELALGQKASPDSYIVRMDLMRFVRRVETFKHSGRSPRDQYQILQVMRKTWPVLKAQVCPRHVSLQLARW